MPDPVFVSKEKGFRTGTVLPDHTRITTLLNRGSGFPNRCSNANRLTDDGSLKSGRIGTVLL
jgi:hypothetical protein